MFPFDKIYMQRCLQLASYGIGETSPNPMVGAVIVHNNRVIGEGYHRRYGEAHAEPNAINSVEDKSLLKESTLYVSLEPCSHQGKTAPCADLIIKHQIPRVVVGTLDPNPLVAGNGIKKLQDANTEVFVGLMEEECRELNKRFFTFFEKKRPFILLKWAQTADGFIDAKRKDRSTPALKISNATTGMIAHKLRSENQAILVGSNTAVLDNPSLNVRNWTGKNPIRILIDHLGSCPADSKIFAGEQNTLVYTEQQKENKERIEYIEVKFDAHLLKSILEDLFKRNINSVLVEGGAATLTGFIEEGLWDEARVELAPLRIKEGIPAPTIAQLPCRQEEYEGHRIFTYKKE